MDEPLIRGYRTAAPIADVPALIARVQTHGARIQLLRSDRVYGIDHLRLAALLATRAIAEQRARAADVATETALYAAGERQIGKALARMGLHEGARNIAAIAWDEHALDTLVSSERWIRDDAILDAREDKLDALGITAADRAVVPREKWGDLVLERVALVDVMKA